MTSRSDFALICSASFVAATQAAVASPLCDELWFARNAVVDQAGYCFGSALGQTLFDNAGCTGQQITLTPSQEAYVEEIRRLEASLACSIDTTRTTLDIADLAARRLLSVQPVPHAEMAGWGCLGYQGRAVALNAAPSASSAQIGRIDAGDWVSVGGHQLVDGWMYVSTYGPSLGGSPQRRLDGDGVEAELRSRGGLKASTHAAQAT